MNFIHSRLLRYLTIILASILIYIGTNFNIGFVLYCLLLLVLANILMIFYKIIKREFKK